jgi:hypothetical protein
MRVFGELLLEVAQRPFFRGVPNGLLHGFFRQIETPGSGEVERFAQRDDGFVDVARLACVGVDDGRPAGLQPLVVSGQAKVHHGPDLGQWLALQLPGDFPAEIQLRTRRRRKKLAGFRPVEPLRQSRAHEQHDAMILA